MGVAGYSPYNSSKPEKRTFRFRLPKMKTGIKKWLSIFLSVIFGFLFLIYLSLGELRFFANHYLGLTFFAKDYLILLQNNYESRPGGGFITGYGTLSTFMGFPTGMSFHNSYDIDTDKYVQPPYPQEEFLKNEWYQGYTFRDANWNPNFPDAAQEIIGFYNQKFPDEDIDGIFVVNFTLIEDLVDKLGGITINGIEINKNNLFSTITHEVNDVDRHNEDALTERKTVLTDLANNLFPKIKWHPFISREAIVEALHNKDLYMWFKSEGLEKKIAEKDWGNVLELPEASDFLAVNIANLGSKKADRYLQKEVHHYVNITKELPEITTEVTIRYPGFTSAYADDYKGYLQLIIPGSATVDQTATTSNITTQGDFKVIGEKIVLPAGSKTTLVYSYTLPRSLFNPGEYNLRLIRQSGDEKWVWVTVETPADSAISSTTFETRENRAMFSGLMTQDRDLSLSLLPDKLAPYPIEQVFSDLKTISIYWNEPIDSSVANDAFNYTITDTNQTDVNTDEVKVVYAEVVDGSVSKLEVEGITNQPLERYEIELKNIRDLALNIIDPNPKKITVVQRIGDKPAVTEPETTTEPTSEVTTEAPAETVPAEGAVEEPVQ